MSTVDTVIMCIGTACVKCVCVCAFIESREGSTQIYWCNDAASPPYHRLHFLWNPMKQRIDKKSKETEKPAEANEMPYYWNVKTVCRILLYEWLIKTIIWFCLSLSFFAATTSEDDANRNTRFVHRFQFTDSATAHTVCVCVLNIKNHKKRWNERE